MSERNPSRCSRSAALLPLAGFCACFCVFPPAAFEVGFAFGFAFDFAGGFLGEFLAEFFVNISPGPEAASGPATIASPAAVAGVASLGGEVRGLTRGMLIGGRA
jgi:hypothetical protein